ncbi:alpha/beta hydrolase [Streptomyces sp. NBC_00239]|uniref:alpha/beta hydrolase n=1 Tax=Streptomyces sp. NBC_00239 TaxID=2903640 RepID=UPI002E2ACF49|nr:alpha/beta hydrolase-fold protein [Streptomyces sp. NBC_00239]
MHQYPQRPRPDDQPYPYPYQGQDQGRGQDRGQGQDQGQQQPYPTYEPYEPSAGRPQQPYGGQSAPQQPWYGEPQQAQAPRQYAPQPPQYAAPPQQPYRERPPYDEQPPYGQQHPPYGPGHGQGGTGGPGGPAGSGGEEPPRRSRRRLGWISAVVAVAVLAGVGVTGWKLDWFNDNGEAVTFGQPPAGTQGEQDPGVTGKDKDKGKDGGRPAMSMPTGPAAEFRRTTRLDDGTSIAKTRLTGAKSGFTGDVWVWVPKEYDDPKYAKSAFPVLISLPGGNGYPTNYWADRSLGLQKAVTEGVKAGTSLPFILIMPVLNPDERNYYDGSDIPGQPKMGTWMAEDIPAFTKANFRTFTSRDGWAFMGNSSGAFVGLKMVMQHPDRFKAVIANGGETAPDSPLWHGDKKLMDANDPGKLAEKLSRGTGPEVYVNFQIGTKEGSQDLARLKKFEKDYGKGPVKITTHVIQNGDHNGWDYVRGMTEGSLEWISKVMAKPIPDAG